MTPPVTLVEPVETAPSPTLGRFLFFFLVGGVILVLGRVMTPSVAILAADGWFCFYCASSFRYKWRFVLVLHPAVLWLLSRCYDESFLRLGDGPAYFSAMATVVGGRQDPLSYVFAAVQAGKFKELSLGVYPTLLGPFYAYGVSDSTTVFYWQSCLLVVFLSICVLLARRWSVMPDRYLYFVVGFAILSPSFFELGYALTRHYVTFVALFLWYISFVAVLDHVSFSRASALGVAIFGVLITKEGYVIPLVAYSVYFLLLERETTGRTWKVAFLSSAVIVGAIVYLPKLSLLYSSYGDIASHGVAKFNFLADVPVLSVFAKYGFAILSPFPWQKAAYLTRQVYGGDVAVFLLHILSALTGLYFFARLARRGFALFRDYTDLRPLLVFGLVMSLSILHGANGFHSYLVVFFPFFAPLFAISRYRMSWLVPVSLAVLAEAGYTVLAPFV